MSTYKELVYMCMDQLKLLSDDSFFTQEHMLFAINAARNAIIAQKKMQNPRYNSTSNMQCVRVELQKVPDVSGAGCSVSDYLKSKEKIPSTLTDTPIEITADSMLAVSNAYISLVPIERLPYVGYNKYLQNIIYAAKGLDDYLYLSYTNPQAKYIEALNVWGTFENPLEIFEKCNNTDEDCPSDILDNKIPIDDDLISTVIDMVVKVLSGYNYRPADLTNNANDDLANIQQFIRNNMKDRYLKQYDD